MSNPQQGPEMRMPKFNMNWIYILALFTIGVLYFTSGNSNSSLRTEASYDQFKSMVVKGYASKIVVNKDKNILHMYVKPEHVRDVFQQGIDKTGKEPSVEVQFGSVDQVEKFVDDAKQKKQFVGDYSYENSRDNDFFGMILYNVLPFVFIIGL